MIGRDWAYGLLGCAGLGLAAIGCSGGGDTLPREPVAGTVTLDGEPLEEGAILFAPAGKPEGAATSATGRIEKGQFAIPRDQGPVPGTYKVAISHAEEKVLKTKSDEPAPARKRVRLGKELIPAKYNSKTELTEEIKRGGASDLKYDLRSK
jgi:hypothetical protein